MAESRNHVFSGQTFTESSSSSLDICDWRVFSVYVNPAYRKTSILETTDFKVTMNFLDAVGAFVIGVCEPLRWTRAGDEELPALQDFVNNMEVDVVLGTKNSRDRSQRDFFL